MGWANALIWTGIGLLLMGIALCAFAARYEIRRKDRELFRSTQFRGMHSHHYRTFK